MSRRRPRRSLARGALLAALLPGAAGAQAVPSAAPHAAPPAASAPAASPSAPAPTSAATAADSAAATRGCVERLPSGRPRPDVVEKFPARGMAGYVAELVVEVRHLKGESLLPGGVHVESNSDEAKQLQNAHFVLPHAEGGEKPSLATEEAGDEKLSRLTLPLIPLPEEPGRRELELPSLPIAMARASGEVFILCTSPHRITIEDPVATEPSPTPHDNPAPRRQLEVWQAAKNALIFGLIALASGALFAWLFRRFKGRVRKGPPPPPPRPPWEVAEATLRDIEASGLIRAGRFDEHFDRVSETIRLYLGDRYGFDGLESTSREALRVLSAVTPSVQDVPTIQGFLREADLVKFARLTPSEEECTAFLSRARTIVERTRPHAPAALETSKAPTEREP